MRILISLLSFRPGMIGGAETYVRRLLAHLAQEVNDDVLVVLVGRDNRDAAKGIAAEIAEVPLGDKALVVERCKEAFARLRARGVERVVEQARPDVILFPQQSIFPSHVDVPCVMTVVDIQHVLLPHHLGAFDRAFRRSIYDRSLRRADHIIAISEFTMRTVVSRCGVPEEKVTVIPLGVSDPEPRQDKDLDEARAPFLFYPAATYRHKNHEQLLRTVAALKTRGELRHRLILTGQRTRLWRRLRRLIAELGLVDDVVHLGFVPYSRMVGLYRSADAVLFPSLFEGFGLPVVEAARLGTKVITSHLEVYDELGVPADSRIDFASHDELARALARPGPTILARPTLSWSEVAARTLAVIRGVAERQSPPRAATG